jgi:hypothetical protein
LNNLPGGTPNPVDLRRPLTILTFETDRSVENVLCAMRRPPQEIAEFVREGMLANDRASRGLGTQVLEVRPARTRRIGVYDGDVTNQHGHRIAVFRGRSYTLQGNAAVPG